MEQENNIEYVKTEKIKFEIQQNTPNGMIDNKSHENLAIENIKTETNHLNPNYTPESESVSQKFSAALNSYQEERKRKAGRKRKADEEVKPDCKLIKVDNFTLKHFLTSAPLEEENEGNKEHMDINIETDLESLKKELESWKDEDNKEDQTDIKMEKDIDLKENLEFSEEFNILPEDANKLNKQEEKTPTPIPADSFKEFERSNTVKKTKKHINKKALSSFFGNIGIPSNLNKKTHAHLESSDLKNKLVQCEFCNVKLKETNLSKHHRKCPAKFAMKTKS